MDKDDAALERTWSRQDEALQDYIDSDTFTEVQRLNISKLRKIAEQEGTTLEDFLDYARNRAIKDKNDLRLLARCS
ncbi:hypothetical protein [Leuconostoc pseudomesenteroides]|uniref:hypothetical protein n=1 Tax=Leuconostoc pseudomesenteroides TaxID=33968 RepID=UPI0039EC8332